MTRGRGGGTDGGLLVPLFSLTFCCDSGPARHASPTKPQSSFSPCCAATHRMWGWHPSAWPSALCCRMMSATAVSAAAPVGGSGPCSSWSIRQYCSCVGRQGGGDVAERLHQGGAAVGGPLENMSQLPLAFPAGLPQSTPAAAGRAPQSDAGWSPAAPGDRRAAARRWRGASRRERALGGLRPAAQRCGRGPPPCPRVRGCLAGVGGVAVETSIKAAVC